MNTKQAADLYIVKMPFHEAEQHSKERQKRFGGENRLSESSALCEQRKVIRILRIK
jgi:hypothetical protein